MDPDTRIMDPDTVQKKKLETTGQKHNGLPYSIGRP